MPTLLTGEALKFDINDLEYVVTGYYRSPSDNIDAFLYSLNNYFNNHFNINISINFNVNPLQYINCNIINKVLRVIDFDKLNICINNLN